jgi:glutaryl-CoA dehydrogenase
MSQTAEKTAKKPAAVLKDSEFNWQDPLDLEGELTEEERMIRDSVREFAQDKLMPRVLLAWREEKVDKELLPEMGAHGLLGPTIPRTPSLTTRWRGRWARSRPIALPISTMRPPRT